MSLLSLATVELQLVLRCCDQRSLLALARCCHHTYAAADSDFAWANVLFHLVGGGSRGGGLAMSLPQRASCLLRHAPVALLWTAPEGGHHQQPHVLEDELDVIGSIPQLTVLDARHRQVLQIRVTSLLQRPGVASLTVLQLPVMHTGDLFQLLPQHTPLLRALAITVHAKIDRAALCPLAELAQLTDLTVLHDSSWGTPVTCLPGIALCSKLQRLTIHLAEFTALAETLAVPRLQQSLRHLHIHSQRRGGALRGVGEKEVQSVWDDVFRSLRQLQTLELHACENFALILVAVQAQCTALDLLRLHPDSIVPGDFEQMPVCPVDWPAPGQLDALLRSREGATNFKLQLQLDRLPLGGASVATTMEPAKSASRAEHQAEWSALAGREHNVSFELL